MAKGRKFLLICFTIWTTWNSSIGASILDPQVSTIRSIFSNNKIEELGFNNIHSNHIQNEKWISVEKRHIPRSSRDSNDGKERISRVFQDTSEHEKSRTAVNSSTDASDHAILGEQSSVSWRLSTTHQRTFAVSDESRPKEENRLKKDRGFAAESSYKLGDEFRSLIDSAAVKRIHPDIEPRNWNTNFEKLTMRKAAQKIASVRSCSVDAGGRCIAWQTGLKSWSEAHKTCRQLGGFLLDRGSVELLRNASYIDVSRRSWLDDGGNGNMAVKFFDFVRKNMDVNSTSSSNLMWTGLTTHQGHYQWLTRIPSVEAVVDWGDQVEFPQRFSADCPALAVTEEGTFRLTPCDAQLPFACDLHPHHGRDTERIETELTAGKLELRASWASSVEPWVEVSTEQFFQLELHCDLFNTSSGEMISLEEMKVFWKKDNVYIGINSTGIHPADIHDPTKSGFIPLNISLDLLVPTKQGTFSCEVWSPKNSEMIKSNKILVTLAEWETFIITFAKVSGSLRPVEILNSLENVYRHEFPYLNNMTKDLIRIKIDSFQQNTTWVTYKFHLYSRVTNRIENKMSGLNSLLQNHFTNGSSIKLVKACMKENYIDALNNIITWPFGRAGPIYPTGTQCQGKNGEPISGTCVPNFTHGAELVLPPLETCARFDACPRGYVNVNTDLCVSVIESSQWEKAFKAGYVTGQEKDILELADGSNDFAILRNLFSDVLHKKTARRQSWVSMRRMYKYWPLVSLKSGVYDFHSLYNISWADLHPLYDKDCAGFDFVSQRMFSVACDESLPFLTVINIKNLKDAIKSQSSALELGLVRRSSDERCLKNGQYGLVPTYDTGSFTCIFRLDGSANNWIDANEYCSTHGATLPQPFLGFMNWIYRKLLVDIDLKALYMNLGNINPAVIIDDPIVEIYDWLPDTDLKNLYGILGRYGWTLTNISHEDVQYIFCEEKDENMEHQEIVLTAETENSILLNTFETKYIKNGTTRCFGNGNLIPSLDNNSDGFQLIGTTELGYYKCFAWSSNPTRFFQSDTILLSNSSSKTAFSVKIHHLRSSYRPSVDDRTFWNGSSATDHHRTILEIFIKMFNTSHASMKILFFAPHEFDVGKYEYSHLTLNHYKQERSYEDYNWLKRLRARHFGNENWTLEDIRPTTGCERDVFHDSTSGLNLTFQRTFGSGEFLAEELCVDSERAPVSRTCHGNFLEGYFWSDALSESCSGSPSNITKYLFGLQRNANDYLSGTYSNLTRNAKLLQPADVHYLAVGLQNLANKQNSSRNDSTSLGLEDLVSTVNNVLSSRQDNFVELNDRLNSTNILLESFERLSSGVRLNPSDEDDSEGSLKSFISTRVLSLTSESPVIGYEDVEVDGAYEGDVIKDEQTGKLSRVMARIILPKNLTRQIASKSGKNVRLVFTTLRKGKLFNERQSENFNYTLNSFVIQASYEGEEVKNLPQPVKIMFRSVQRTNDTICAFWDFKKSEGLGGWSRNGCRKSEENNNTGLTTCYCNHLTYFALLVNFNTEDLTEAHAFSLQTITIVGGLLSISGLLMVFLTFSFFKKWRRSLTNKILVNLSVAVFFSMVIFLGGINQTEYRIVCRSVAVALHYFILASFGWMLVEGVHQYYKFVKVLAIYIPGFLRKAAICAWGLPFIPIICLLVYDSSLYENQGEYSVGNRICWISFTGFTYAFLPPLAITMAINLILYAMIIRSAICRSQFSPSPTNRDLLINQLSMAVCVFFLLGFTWIFGLLAIRDTKLIFSYLFCIFNTLQGFFIFLFHVCRNRSVRSQWSVLWSTVTGHSNGMSSYTSAVAHSQSRNISGTSDSNYRPRLNDSSSVSSSPVVFSQKGRVKVATEESQIT